MKRPNTFFVENAASMRRCKLLYGDSPRPTTRSEFDAFGLLQHYGLPTSFVDFTGDLGLAFTFAAAKVKVIGRVCVFPLAKFPSALAVANFAHHQWAERARRQEAFGLATTPAIIDFKSPKARAELGLQWFEFPITSTDHDFFHSKHDSLISWANDPSAGFIRHEITT
jgi:FRG domain